MRGAFPEFAADWLLLCRLLRCRGRRCRPRKAGSFPYSDEMGRKSAHTLRSNLQHDRCDEEKQAGAQLSGERTRDQTTNDSAHRAADSDKSEKPFGLRW